MMIKLKDTYLFEWVNDELVFFIIDNSRRVEYIAWDSIIFQWQESDNTAYIIQSGVAEVEIDWEEVAKLHPWDIFWEIALITNEKRTATVRAKTDLVLLKITKELLQRIIKELKNWKDLQTEIIRRIRENHDKQKS